MANVFSTNRRLLATGLVLIAAFAMFACASTSPAVRYYTFSVLPYPAQSKTGNEPQRQVVVASMKIPAHLDRPHIVTRDGSNTIEVAEYDRWASPLREELAWAVAENLSALLGSGRVVSAVDIADNKVAYRVTINVRRFEGWTEGGFKLSATWTVKAPGDKGAVREGRTMVEEPIIGSGMADLAAAASRAVIALSRDIAAAIGGG
jgi:uncharacterized lipoprotein YmbA